MKRKILAILLCVSICFSLSGCGSEKTEDTSSEERAASVSNGSLKPDSSVIAVGKTTVTYKEYKTYYYFMKSRYEGILGSEIWHYNKVVEGEKTIGQEAIESVLRLIIQVKVICKEAAIDNVKLETDEKEEADFKAKTAYEAISEQDRTENGTDLALVTKIFEENKLVQKMYNVEIGKVKTELTADQVRAAKVQLIYRKADDKNKASVKAEMEKIRQSLGNTQSGFYVAAKENTQADEVECIVGNSDDRTNLSQAVLALKKGQVSGVIEEKDGFYIACCVEPESAKLQQEYRNQVVQDNRTKAFQKAYEKWSDKFQVKLSKTLLSDNG